ncbi:MAG: hypothetical protein ALECFALPRED_000603 [Alectoria fallacina]|uniref:Uncharacterized protein n=1 Tax=Alectoria fallacina TaxID=1903189 RepID=A0A8H3JA18_9LECA|nr:MAG: hypothetical protein ALECFALPRED_000603 [Alectoria fallacina]
MGAYGRPVLTLFLWKNGASFDRIMNKYTSAPYPAGIDPRTPIILKAFNALNSSVNILNGTLPEGIDFSHPAPLVHPNVFNSSSGPSDNTVIDVLLTDSS